MPGRDNQTIEKMSVRERNRMIGDLVPRWIRRRSAPIQPARKKAAAVIDPVGVDTGRV
jgi:hypothetical protein